MTAQTLTAAINTNLSLVAVVCVVLLIGILLYRVTHIIASMAVDALLFASSFTVMQGVQDKLQPLQRFAQLGVLGYAAQFVALVVLSGVRLVVSAFRVALFVVYASLPLLVLSFVLALIQERWNDSVAVLTDVFDDTLSATLRTVLLTPLTVLDTIGSMVLPVYNLSVFAFVQMPLQVFMWLLRGAGATHLLLAMRELAAAAPELVRHGSAFIEANAALCQTSYCVNDTNVYTGQSATTCLTMARGVVAQACLDPVRREFNLVPALAHLQQAASHGLLSLGASCDALALVLNVTLFPLTDPTLWYAVDRGINALLSAVVVAPVTAARRCAIAGGFLARPAMCTPDLGHAWDLAAAATLHLGDALTHWIDGLYLVIFDGETIQSACATGNDYAGLWNDRATRRLFGSNATALVRLTTTAFALTDGLSAVYVYENPLIKGYVPGAWPFRIDTMYGVARALLPSGVDASDGGVGLFGCACADVAAPSGGLSDTMLELRCATITRHGDVHVTPVAFSLGAQTQLLTCDRARIHVQSVRWPRRRAAVAQLLGSGSVPQCTSSSNACLAADVAIWLTPVCGAQDGVKALACLPEKSFTRGICFPYCLALRMRHEGFVRPIAMRGAAEWTDGVIMAARDCVPSATAAASSTAADDKSTVRSVCTIAADASGSGLPQTSKSAVASLLSLADSTAACPFAAACTTVFPDKTVFDTYSGNSTLPALVDTASGGSRLLLNGQPLVIGGGTFMRHVTPLGGSSAQQPFYDFPSLVGNTYNEFTIEPYGGVGTPGTRVNPAVPSKQVLIVDAFFYFLWKRTWQHKKLTQNCRGV
jgi:hypothetical protein